MNLISRAMKWLQRDKDVAEVAKITNTTTKAKPVKVKKMRDTRGTLSMHDVRCLHIGGMSLESIRRCYGRDAAKYVSKMVTRNERKATA